MERRKNRKISRRRFVEQAGWAPRRWQGQDRSADRWERGAGGAAGRRAGGARNLGFRGRRRGHRFRRLWTAGRHPRRRSRGLRHRGRSQLRHRRSRHRQRRARSRSAAAPAHRRNTASSIRRTSCSTDLTDWSVVETNGMPDYRYNDRGVQRALADNEAPAYEFLLENGVVVRGRPAGRAGWPRDRHLGARGRTTREWTRGRVSRVPPAAAARSCTGRSRTARRRRASGSC